VILWPIDNASGDRPRRGRTALERNTDVSEQLILKSFQSPGDIVMLSAAIRDLHRAHPNRFVTDVRTSAPAIWENNPYLTPLDEHDSAVTTINMHYPAIHQSNQRPYHFIHGYAQHLEQQLNVRIPMTAFRGDIHLSDEEESAPALGKQHTLHGLCRKVIVRGDRDSFEGTRYQRRYALDWDECRASHGDCPSTKVTQCLVEVFKLKPIAALCGYQIQRSARADQLARAYLEQVCHAAPDSAGRYPAVLIHYAGNTSADKKNLSHDVVRDVCDVVLAAGATPVILDWDRRSPLPDGQRIFNPDADHPMWGGHGTGDAGVLAALIEHARLMVGVDSGPLHVAGATSTETIGVWTQHHPVYYFDLADNVLHFVPANHEQLARGAEAAAYFQRGYQHQTYRELAVDLPTLVESCLTGEEFQRIANRRFLARLSAHAYDRRYHEEHRHAGLDYLAFGQRQQDYGRWLVDSLQLEGKRVLDVGCACGAIARGLQQAGARVGGIDLNEYMIQLGREQWPDMRDQLNVCDAVNLHLFEDGCWDVIHSAQSAEHWKPELVPHILDELKCVMVPGGAFFCTLDTEELIARQVGCVDHVLVFDTDTPHAVIRAIRPDVLVKGGTTIGARSWVPKSYLPTAARSA